MTPNTSPKKPAWFELIQNDAPSAQVRKIDKKLPIATAFVALAIVASGTFFANGSLTSQSPATGSLASVTGSNTVNSTGNSSGNSNVESLATNTKVSVSAPVNTIVNPTLNGGGDDRYDDDDDDDDYDDDDRDDEEDDD